jgi:hypothetical protein
MISQCPLCNGDMHCAHNEFDGYWWVKCSRCNSLTIRQFDRITNTGVGDIEISIEGYYFDYWVINRSAKLSHPGKRDETIVIHDTMFSSIDEMVKVAKELVAAVKAARLFI